MTDKFTKLYITLKFRLHGMGFFKAIEALELGRSIHDGWRKDGKTPEYQHQLEIALYLLTLKDAQDLEKVIICALLHDVLEDYPDKIVEGKSLDTYILFTFGDDVRKVLWLLDKNRWSNLETYFEGLAMDPVGSIVKLADRVNNFQSMNRGKFTIEKQRKYAKEVEDHFLPMAKKARKRFPRQMDAYYNVETMLKHQLELVHLFIEASSK